MMRPLKEIPVSQLMIGSVLAQPVTLPNGVKLLEAGTELTEGYIKKIRKMGIKTVVVIDEQEEKSQRPRPAVQVHDRSEPVQKVYHTLSHLANSDKVRGRMSVPVIEARFVHVFESILEELVRHEFLLGQLADMYVKDPFLFDHSINVAVLSGMLGTVKQYDRHKLYELVFGAFLFDCGMLDVPAELIKRNRPLTPEEKKVLEYHTAAGYNKLVKREDVPKRSALCALQHHERYNGSGYPHKLKKGEIHEYAQIVAIADVYHAMISPRYHRKPYTPAEASEYLAAAGNYFFDLELVKLFLTHISIYPVASKVMLSNGQIGVVSSVHSGLAHRPVVTVIQEADGSVVPFPYKVDLQENLDVVIVNRLSG
ncbi:HD-GYP domain-containing protein [Brevibacillus thermoruber]|jgi:HD-GYP domain-containing protein (c-di-GMP phosphodiesterase class II)|uniref:HD-GYP domain-containing protein n=1 Tax=Brevibacillus thermoruber TaxID=33942 RepID=UPI004043346E